MMTETAYFLQVSIKTGPGYESSLINLPAATTQELEDKLRWVTENAHLIIAAETAVHAVGKVAPLAAQTASVSFQQDVPTQNWGQPRAAPPAFVPTGNPVQQGGPPAPSCQHGARVWKEGTSKAGKPYKLWACPSRNQNDQCAPVWG
jgi:hypothetical protein